MGTRSLTIFNDGGEREIVVMYRQMDGYLEGHGVDLAEFLSPFIVVNGIGVGDNRVIANGMSCLAAQAIAHFKTGVGSIYLYPAGTRDAGEEYIYYVIGDESFLRIDVYETRWESDPYRTIQKDEPLFSGSPQELLEAIKEGKLKD